MGQNPINLHQSLEIYKKFSHYLGESPSFQNSVPVTAMLLPISQVGNLKNLIKLLSEKIYSVLSGKG